MAYTLKRLEHSLLDDSLQVSSPPSCKAAASSRFGVIAAPSDGQPAHLEEVLDIMFAAARPDRITGPLLLRPLWAEEALQRVYTMMRLVDARKRRGGACAGPGAAAELAAAEDLAALYGSLEACHDRDNTVPLSPILQDSVAALVTLFGAVAEDITLRVDIEALNLRPYQRRAMVLAAGELVMNALLHGFIGRTSGWIGVILTMVTPRFGRLQVADDGGGFDGRQPNIRFGVASGLTDLLAGDLAYYRTSRLTIAEIIFPLDCNGA